jgi:hypothetical protein
MGNHIIMGRPTSLLHQAGRWTVFGSEDSWLDKLTIDSLQLTVDR